MDPLIRISPSIYLITGSLPICVIDSSLVGRGEANVQRHTNRRIWQYFKQHKVASIVLGHVLVASMLGMLVVGNLFGGSIMGAFAQSPCSSGDQVYIVVSGDTLGVIAQRYHKTWQDLASYNKLSDPNLIYIDQHICIPGSNGTVKSGPPPIMGVGNFFPYGQCTWWAAQRYHTIHGIYVPWTTNSDAWAWSARAEDFHWKVSNKPAVGDIIDLQPWVEGAYSLGHVAVVEQVLNNGHVIASNMNWGVYYWEVTNVEFAPGPGVTFISV